MQRVVAIGLLLLTPFVGVGQSPSSLETYASPDRSFQFLYPDTYELLDGDRIAKATQGRNVTFPVCSSLTALACVIYPFERLGNSNFEAAAFSVNRIRTVTTASDCEGYADLAAPPRNARLRATPSVIHGHLFLAASDKASVVGHSQSAYLYRSFQKEGCYELRIAISVSDIPLVPPSPDWKAFTGVDADRVRDKLKLILSSFDFLK